MPINQETNPNYILFNSPIYSALLISIYLSIYLSLSINLTHCPVSQSGGAVEYIDCFSAEG